MKAAALAVSLMESFGPDAEVTLDVWFDVPAEFRDAPRYRIQIREPVALFVGASPETEVIIRAGHPADVMPTLEDPPPLT